MVWEKLPVREIDAIFGNASNGWVPTSVAGLVEGIDSVSLHDVPIQKLIQIYKLLELDYEPRDFVDRVRAGLEKYDQVVEQGAAPRPLRGG